MEDVLSTRGYEIETFSPDKVGRAERRVGRRLRPLERERLALASVEAHEAAEPELEEPAPISNWPERQATLEEQQTSWTIRLLDEKPLETPETLFAKYYGEDVTGRLKESALAFLRKASRTPAGVGSVIGFNADTWLIVDSAVEGDTQVWVVVPLERVYDELRGICGGVDKPILDVEACPRSIARLDTSSKIRKDFVTECQVVHRIGRVSRFALNQIREGMKLLRSRGEFHARFREDWNSTDQLLDAQSLFLERNAAVTPQT